MSGCQGLARDASVAEPQMPYSECLPFLCGFCPTLPDLPSASGREAQMSERDLWDAGVTNPKHDSATIIAPTICSRYDRSQLHAAEVHLLTH